MTGNRRGWVVGAAACVLGGCLVATLSCGLPVALVNDTTSLGGTTVGGRGHVQVALINNTQYFVSMTFGTYDPLDKSQTLVGFDPTNPSVDVNFSQLFADSTHVNQANFPNERLDPGATSTTVTFLNGRTISLGDRGFIQAIKDRDTNAKNLTLTEGITFSDKLLDAEGVQQFTINGVANQTQLLGTNYQPESLLIFTFQPDATQATGVRIDVNVTLP